ncbi:MAG: alginate lyase family protein [Lamprobacter sp.]|uniref:alginate lyase family protein n=1 Tax=Lamprobacter sp. TaxID=3100796 RepID=UPI002B2580DE|nr:alginate lyase family protein [Lamprobacter sp.]MEA3643446.1 alginate lyase family protein [Lamprobacter sp.]
MLGNHLFANTKALVFAGAFFVGPEAERWLRQGQRLLRRELQEQILPDGGHFERSPMYHAILLEDVLDLLRLGQLYPGTLDAGLLKLCESKATAMQHWLAAMTHPDGEISFFNDAAFGIASTQRQLAHYAESLRGRGNAGEPQNQVKDGPPRSTPTLIWLRDSGYLRLEAGQAVALLDCAPIGPDYLPGHAHADTLSFEFSLFGQRVIVNGGTSRYGSGPERLAERGTAAHSTVQIDSADSSEVWGGFRVARRARPFDVSAQSIQPTEAEKRQPRDPLVSAADANPLRTGLSLTPHLAASSAHDGYRRLPGKPVHRRAWTLSDESLLVTDRIDGRYRSASARFHLHPEVKASIQGNGGELRLPDGQTLSWQVTGGEPQLVPDHWRPEFGRSLPSQCLHVQMAAGDCFRVARFPVEMAPKRRRCADSCWIWVSPTGRFV